MNGTDEDLQEHDELVDCGGVWMVGQVDVLVEQACDVGIPNGFFVPRRTCKASLGRRDAVDQHRCRNSFEVLNRDLAIEESEVWVNKVDVVGEKLTRLSAMTFNEADVKEPLASAVEIAKAGNRIVLEADGGYIENAKTGEKMKVDVDIASSTRIKCHCNHLAVVHLHLVHVDVLRIESWIFDPEAAKEGFENDCSQRDADQLPWSEVGEIPWS